MRTPERYAIGVVLQNLRKDRLGRNLCVIVSVKANKQKRGLVRRYTLIGLTSELIIQFGARMSDVHDVNALDSSDKKIRSETACGPDPYSKLS